MSAPTEEEVLQITFEEYKDYIGNTDEALKKHYLCPQCGAYLHFNYLSDFKNKLMQETARCNDCQVRIRARLHKMQ